MLSRSRSNTFTRFCCIEERRPKQIVLPLGNIDAPTTGWLVIAGFLAGVIQPRRALVANGFHRLVQSAEPKTCRPPSLLGRGQSA
jgi:hypothetical protein